MAVLGRIFPSRSPYGERGLKYVVLRQAEAAVEVALLTESVD